MIITQLTGGLGNQMFQYAMARSCTFRSGTSLLLDVSAYKKHTKRSFGLFPFNIEARTANLWEIYKQKIFGNVLREKRFEFCKEHLSIADNTYIENYFQSWQSEKYFKDTEAIVRQEFQLREPLKEKFPDICDLIEKSESVSVHIRRGDYVSKQDTYALPSLEYYVSGMSLISDKTHDPKFFFFSDDMDWVKKKIQLPKNSVLVSDGTYKDFEELSLQALCKHHIIANSSFSWWGAWLGNYPSKIIIAPKRWFNPNKHIEERDLVPLEWIRM